MNTTSLRFPQLAALALVCGCTSSNPSSVAPVMDASTEASIPVDGGTNPVDSSVADSAVGDSSSPVHDSGVADAVADSAPSGPSLTINNTSAWCNVTASIGGTQVASFSGASATIAVTSGVTVNLTATPQTGYQPAVWTGTTTGAGPTPSVNATYLTTSSSTQTISVYCSL